jgi:predicted transcriptional regulator
VIESARGNKMQETNHIKEEALRLIEALPDDATWEDLTRLMLERQMIEEGIQDSEAGRVWTSDQIREKLGMSK